MSSENATDINTEVPPVRITRAQAKRLGCSTGLPPSSRQCFKQEQKQKHPVQTHLKRAASDENKTSANGTAFLRNKKRAVLTDVTNISSDVISAKPQTSKHSRKGPAKKERVVLNEKEILPITQNDSKAHLAKELSKIRVEESLNLTELSNRETGDSADQSQFHSLLNVKYSQRTAPSIYRHDFMNAGKEDCPDSVATNLSSIVDIDSTVKDPQACSLYAGDIYKNIHILELDRRPSTNYMEALQQDITASMRGILIDWLVEVSEEYRLASDTLYLTVNLIDRFLSQKLIEKQRLQLLGVTCMLIASKYEEICAPRVEEFCFITDNTYTRDEVLKMETEVLNLLYFQFAVPTVKPFLRRFIQAAQVSYEDSSIELEFLANYLAELTLVEYSFIQFLPSLIAASAVFLARWTLNQSTNPWNTTLEYYTGYKALELKTTVLELEDLQRDTSGCSLNAIREKYKQQKFKRVATLTPAKPVRLLFP